jgi:exodeoxyribonuclease VII small subunit
MTASQMPPSPRPLEDESFELLYNRLQEVTARLESGDLPLEHSVALYEEGMRLARRCQDLLSGVEQRIEVLRQAFDDTRGAEPDLR